MELALTTRPRRIDAHQHYWSIGRGDYGWIQKGDALDRDYLPADLAPLNAAAGIDQTIVVQAAPTVAETDWLLALAPDEPSILGVVGWAPLDDPDDPTLDRLGADAGCVGVRPMLQDLPDDWIERRVERETLERVAAHGLVFDVLARPAQLLPALHALEQVPELVAVIDHLGKPDYASHPGAWADAMRSLAARPGTHCKLSGLITELGPGWARDDVRAHAEVALQAFGPDRVLFGSDWPVCLTAGSHRQVVDLAGWLLEALEPVERDAVFGGNAARIYHV
jgi:L-fuconolactonase